MNYFMQTLTVHNISCILKVYGSSADRSRMYVVKEIVCTVLARPELCKVMALKNELRAKNH